MIDTGSRPNVVYSKSWHFFVNLLYLSYFTVGGSSYERIVSVYKEDVLDGVFSILDGTFYHDKPVWKNDTKFLFFQGKFSKKKIQ